MTKICTITTTSSNEVSNASHSPTINGKINGVGKVPAPSTKLPKTTESAPDKCAEIFRSMGDKIPFTFDKNEFDFDDCNISKLIKFLQKLCGDPGLAVRNTLLCIQFTIP